MQNMMWIYTYIQLKQVFAKFAITSKGNAKKIFTDYSNT